MEKGGPKMPAIKASKATVEADSITSGNRKKHHQTNTQNAQTRIAKGTVEIEIIKQYPTRTGNYERPRAGSVLHGDTATISARTIRDKVPKNPKRDRSTFERDVTIDLRRRKTSKKKVTTKKK